MFVLIVTSSPKMIALAALPKGPAPLALTLLLAIKERCPGLGVDRLYPRSEPWMKLDVVQYQAIQRARLASARAVHLHPTQLTAQVVAGVRAAGIEVHAWDVNDEDSLDLVTGLGIPRLCTDRFAQAYAYRERRQP